MPNRLEENEKRNSLALDARLRAISRYKETFSASGFNFGEWRNSEQTVGAQQTGWFELSVEGASFVRDAYEFGWVQDFDWMHWLSTEEAEDLLQNEKSVLQADVGQLEKLITACIREDRFCEGALLDHYRSGLLTRITQRARLITERAKK